MEKEKEKKKKEITSPIFLGPFIIHLICLDVYHMCCIVPFSCHVYVICKEHKISSCGVYFIVACFIYY